MLSKKHARTQTSHHPILVAVQKPEGGGRTAVIRPQKQLLQIAQEALLTLGECQAFATTNLFPSHCLMDNARWLTRLIKCKCFQMSKKNLCGMQSWSCMLMAEFSFQLHRFASLALDFQSSTMCSRTQRQRTVLPRDALQKCLWSPHVLDYRMMLSWLLLLRVHVENWAYKWVVQRTLGPKRPDFL